jgi:molybdopterin converting factor small subunit
MEVRVTVKYSFYRKYLTDREHDKVALKEGATVRQAVDQLGVSEYYLSRITVNEEERGLDFVLSDADSVVIWPPRIGGG